MAQIIQFPKKQAPASYEAKLTEVIFGACTLRLHLAGTLDGFIDFAVIHADGTGFTYQLTCDDARHLIAGLHATVEDVQKNCLFDADPLLEGRKD